MDSNNDNKNSQEIDLSYLLKSFGSFFKSVEVAIFKNIIVLSILVIAGIIIGYFLDKQSKTTYKQEIIITANFGSSDYLYKKISSISFDEDSSITDVKIEPIVDVYSFLNEGNGWTNLNIAKYLSENNIEISKYKKGNQTEKMYKYHLLTLYTNKKDADKSIVNDFLHDLNQDPYFLEKQKLGKQHTEFKIKEYLTSINSINAYFERLGNQSTSSGTDFNVQLNSQINDLLNSKNNFVKEIESLKTLQLEQDKIFYETSILSNIKVKSTKKTIILPALFIGLYLVFLVIRKRYISIKKISILEK